MGVPQFVSWLLTILPEMSSSISKDVKIDNLYLDMNGIFYTFKNLTEDEMILRIFMYIEQLVDITSPKKNLFLAIDGVAPLSKQTQQRQRRWSSSETTQQFDTKSITPGTDFMYQLSKHIDYFIHLKMSQDEKWKNLKVYFSDGFVPGEGEHKIIDFIRKRKEEDDLSKEEVHCMYGMDADLVMIGLATHLENFYILREGTSKNFFTLNLKILRNHIQKIFNESILERVIDDFILMLFLCGNDFLPMIPTLDIGEGALNYFFKIYKDCLSEMKGYITDSNNGEIDFERLKIFVKELSKFEKTVLEERVKGFKVKKEKKEKKEDKPEEVDIFEKSLLNASYINLFPFIDITQSEVLNGDGDLSSILTQPNNINEEFIKSKSDEQMLIKIKFGFTCKLNSLILYNFDVKTLPSKIKIFINHESMDFSDITNFECIQEIDFEKNHQPNEIKLKFIKLQKVNHLTIFIVNNHSNSKNTCISHLSLFGIPNINNISLNQTLTKVTRKRYFKSKRKKYFKKKVIINELNVLNECVYVKDNKNVLDYSKYKQDYYKIKMNFTKKEEIEEMIYEYCKGLLWNFLYYFKGCPSLEWFYPFHYSPLLSDLCEIKNFKFNFKLGSYLKPFEQLVSILPPKSFYLLPEIYQKIYLNEEIQKYFPKETKLDYENMKYDPLKIIPFIPIEIVKKLISEIDTKHLNDLERERNEFRKLKLYEIDKNMNGYDYKSTHNSLPDLNDIFIFKKSL